MRDQLDAQIWNAHHDRFSEWLDGAIARTGGTLASGGSLAARVPGQLVAGLFAVGLTLITIGGSAA